MRVGNYKFGNDDMGLGRMLLFIYLKCFYLLIFCMLFMCNA